MTSAGPSGHRPVERRETRATFLELFFDLVYVFALTRIGARAFEDLAVEPGHADVWRSVTGGGKTLLLVFALWAVWQGTAWTTSRYDPHHIWLQTLVITALVGSMVMGVAIPRAYSESGLAFAVPYVVVQVSRPAILLVALGAHRFRRLKLRMLITYCVTGVLWVVGALLPTNPRVVLWVSALVIEYVAMRVGWPVPGLGRSTISRWDIAGEHLAERYQQFFLIALGETILVAGLAYTGHPPEPARTGAFAMALVTSVLLWSIYVQRAGQILGDAVTKAAHPATIGRSAADTHLVMVVGLVFTAIGYELVMEHPTGPNEIPWLAMTLGGPVLFLAAGHGSSTRSSAGCPRRAGWPSSCWWRRRHRCCCRRCRCSRPWSRPWCCWGVAIADARRAWGRPPEPAAPPF